MPRISQKVLTEQLRELVDDGIVHQQRTGPVPAPVVYSLTDYGRSVLPIAESVRLWGHGHIDRFVKLETRDQ
jgi:DNA-binding HxlR family transcriptional regulator